MELATKTAHGIIKQLYNIGAIHLGEFTLKSGQTSKIYVDLRRIISYPSFLRQIATIMWDTIAHKFDVICGVPYTALPIATCMALDHNIPLIMRRKEKKNYGTKREVEGEFQVGMRCLVVEDVITTGGSVLETIADLEKNGLIIDNIVALIDREQGGIANIGAKYPITAIFNLGEIISLLAQIVELNSHERQIIASLNSHP